MKRWMKKCLKKEKKLELLLLVTSFPVVKLIYLSTWVQPVCLNLHAIRASNYYRFSRQENTMALQEDSPINTECVNGGIKQF